MKQVGLAALGAIVLLVLATPLLTRNKPEEGLPPVFWDMRASGLFDESNKSYTIVDGTVTVEPQSRQGLCPTGLGHLASGMSTVKVVAVKYESPAAGKAWLHAVWNPGGSGEEQFEVYCNGQPCGQSAKRNGAAEPYQDKPESFEAPQQAGTNTLELRALSGDGLHFKELALASSASWPLQGVTAPAAAEEAAAPAAQTSEGAGFSDPPPVRPDLKFPTLASYERTIGEPGVLLQDDYVWVFAPKRFAREAAVVHPYLSRAYEVLKRKVGQPTEFKIVVYHFPPNHPDAFGGTSNCVLWYGYENLDFARQEEWTRYKMPHLCGYIEEMGHNFVGGTKAQFGWESMGWTIGTEATMEVAPNPVLESAYRGTRATQAETYRRYRAAGNVFPPDIEANLVDRIHAYLLNECEQRYGPAFWPDFFREIRKEYGPLRDAVQLPEAQIRDARYRITVDCFDRLPGLRFKEMLRENGISTTRDVKSMDPTSPGWNRRLE